MNKGIIISAGLAITALIVLGYFYTQNTGRPAGQAQDATVSIAEQNQPGYICTIAPLGAIMRELCKGRATVDVLLSAGASPHTYEPKPSDLKRVMQASGFFYVDERLDGWATSLQSEHLIKVLDFVPEPCRLKLEQSCCPKEHAKAGHKHEPITDPHFWLDPCVVRDTLPGLTARLIEQDPAGRAIYEANFADFTLSLNEMDAELHAIIDPLRGSKVATAHQSFQYLCHQYGLKIALVVTDSPGKEPSPRRIEELCKQVKSEQVKAIYSEPQIPHGAAKMLSEASGVPMFELDPVGGCSGRCEYRELILYNAHVLADSLS